MKKLLIILLLSTPVHAAPLMKLPAYDFLGFKQLCDDLGHTWGWLGNGRACFTARFAKRNGYTLQGDNWVK